jgi:hypothetical protein
MHHHTDIGRWMQTENLDPNWDQRAEFALAPVAKSLAVVDVGCGQQSVKRIAQPSRYLGIDVVTRDSSTYVIDLNSEPLSNDVFKNHELVTAFGLIEYLNDPSLIFKGIADEGLCFVLSYKILREGDTVDRRSQGWINDYTASELKHELEHAGLTIVHETFFDKSEIIIYATPRGYLFPWAEGPNPPRPKKKRIILSGFFGRGNCGDEALLQSAYQIFSPHFDITISVDLTGSFDGFWNWFPYNQCEIIHQCNNSIENQYSAYILCGGGLPIGFAANQIMAARFNDVKTYCFSVDPPDISSLRDSDRKFVVDSYYGSFNRIHFRTPLQIELPSLSSRIATNGDLALLLEPDSSDLAPMGDTVLITLREWAIGEIQPEYVGAVLRAVAQIKMAGLKPVWFPFAPEDTRFINELKIASICEILESWWNPRRAMEYIEKAAGTLSIGRLHPLIFAAKVKGNAASFNITVAGGLGISPGKISNICRLLEIPQLIDFAQLDDWIQATKAGGQALKTPDPKMIEALISHSNRITEEILDEY